MYLSLLMSRMLNISLLECVIPRTPWTLSIEAFLYLAYHHDGFLALISSWIISCIAFSNLS